MGNLKSERGEAGPGRPRGTGKPKKSRQLLDMDHVYRTEAFGEDGKAKDFPNDTPGQRQMRALFRESIEKFLGLMQRYRDHYDKKCAEYAKRTEAKEELRAVEPDAKSAELQKLIAKLLDGWEEESRG